MNHRVRAWTARWGPIAPLLVAELTIWIGFGALLPILPIYFTEHGVDIKTLGVVVAAWPAARLVGEPLFGWLADRVPRKPLMVTGLLLASAFAVLPLYIVGPVAFVVFRALSGFATAMYDPAARGYIVDANPPERHGEAFGVYGSAQTGGFLIGPALGGIAAAVTGQPTVVFWIAGITLLVSAVLVAWRVPEREHVPVDLPEAEGGPREDAESRPRRLFNILLVSAMAFTVASYFAGGSYEVIWSLYLTSLGANLGQIGLTFFSFGLPPLLLSPFMGRFIDREGGFLALTLGLAGIGISGLLYPAIPEIWWMVVLGIFEGAAFAAASPAIYLLVARSSPVGRTSTAQGIIGASGTIATIFASILAGYLASTDLRLPFWATGTVSLIALGIGLLIGRRRLYVAMQPRRPAPVPGPATEAAL